MQIVYTPAKPFNRKWFLLRLATVAAIVLAWVFGMSIFFKVQTVTVAGVDKYTEWEIFEASGIQKGEALLGLNRARAIAKIRTALPYVGDVRIGIKLPDTVMIEITELKAVYAIEDTEAGWWLMDATGRLVDSTDGAAAKDYPRVIGVKIENPTIGQQAKAAEPTTDPTDPSNPTNPSNATEPSEPDQGSSNGHGMKASCKRLIGVIIILLASLLGFIVCLIFIRKNKKDEN